MIRLLLSFIILTVIILILLIPFMKKIRKSRRKFVDRVDKAYGQDKEKYHKREEESK